MAEWIERYEIRATVPLHSGFYYAPHNYEIFDRKTCTTICIFSTADKELNKELAKYVLEYLSNQMIRGGII